MRMVTRDEECLAKLCSDVIKERENRYTEGVRERESCVSDNYV